MMPVSKKFFFLNFKEDTCISDTQIRIHLRNRLHTCSPLKITREEEEDEISIKEILSLLPAFIHAGETISWYPLLFFLL